MTACSKCAAAADRPHCKSFGCGWVTCVQGHNTSLIGDAPVQDAAADDAA